MPKAYENLNPALESEMSVNNRENLLTGVVRGNLLIDSVFGTHLS